MKYLGGTCSGSMSEADMGNGEVYRGKGIVIDKVLAGIISAIVDLITLVPIGDEITVSPPHNGHVDVQLKAGPTREVIKKVHVPLDDS